MGNRAAGRWQRWAIDSAYTTGAVALASLAHVALGEEFTGRAPFLVSLLAVFISATRGGFVQGLFATLLSLGLELSLWGGWRWLAPATGTYHFVEIVLYLVEGIVISLLAQYYLNGRLALRHSQTRFQVLFNSLPVGAMIHHQNKIVDANKTLADMFGYPLRDMIGGRATAIVAPESLAQAREQVEARPEESYRITGVRRDGSSIPLEVYSREIDYQGRPMRFVVMRDLTDHLLAHERLEQMNELLETRVNERTTALVNTVAELRAALENVKTLSGLLPICSNCKRIRDDDGYWSQVEDFISAHSTAEFSHSLCPDCLAALRDEIADRHRRHDDAPQA